MHCRSCWPGKFRCLDHTCVGVNHRCDGIWDCVAGEDEMSCHNADLCSDNQQWQFACRSGRQCVAMSKYCDGVTDCDDGSDEREECGCHTSGQFACNGGRQCISR